MMPTEKELKMIAEKVILLLPAHPTATDIIKNIHQFLFEWYKKNEQKPISKLYTELRASEIF